MTSNRKAAWEDARPSIFCRQVKSSEPYSDPIPGFFQTRAANSQPQSEPDSLPIRNTPLKAVDDSFIPPSRSSYSPTIEEDQFYEEERDFFSPSRYVIMLPKISLFGLIGGLFLMGMLFFAGGFLVAFTSLDKAAVMPALPTNQVPGLSHSSLDSHHESLPSPSSVPLSQPDLQKDTPQAKISYERPKKASSKTRELTQEASQKVSIASQIAPSLSAIEEEISLWEGKKEAMSKQETQKSPAASADKAKQSVIDAEILARPYALQVGVFSTKSAAIKVASLLRKRGYHSYVVMINHAPLNNSVFGVRLGGFYTQQAARKAAEHLQKKEKFKVVAVARNNADRAIL